MALNISSKRLQIDKANLNIVIAVSLAAFVTMFSLVASKALLEQRSYQNQVIAKKEVARDNLISNLDASKKLVESYRAFVSTPDNIIAGNPTGQGDRDGDNARIVLDALPSKYDFPALTTSLDKIFSSQNYKIESISGTDDEVNQSKTDQAAASQVVEIPFQVTLGASASTTEGLLKIFERSIRPMHIQTLVLSGKGDSLTVSVTAKTFYQPEKVLQIKSEVVKQK